MSNDLETLGSCIDALDGCNTSVSNGISSLDRILYPNGTEVNEFSRLAKIVGLKKHYRIYPISYVNEQIGNYNSIKDDRILSVVETLEKLNELKTQEKETHMGFVELLQTRLEQFVNYNKRESILSSGGSFEDMSDVDLTKEEQDEIEKIQSEIDAYKFQISKLQLKKLKNDSGL